MTWCLVKRQGGGLGDGRMWKFSSGSVLFSWEKNSTAADGSEEGERVSEGRKKRKGLKDYPSHQKIKHTKEFPHNSWSLVEMLVQSERKW